VSVLRTKVSEERKYAPGVERGELCSLASVSNAVEFTRVRFICYGTKYCTLSFEKQNVRRDYKVFTAFKYLI
jgi:hypothetical protein